ncbi:MAG TPA: hypothetical protein VIU15_39310, partial [Streptomyces sp.]
SLPRPSRWSGISTRAKILTAAVTLVIGVSIPVTLSLLQDKGDGSSSGASSSPFLGPYLSTSVPNAGTYATFSPDGKLIAAAGSTTVQLLLASGGTAQILDRQTHPLFSGAGNLLATVDARSTAKMTVHLWDTATNDTSSPSTSSSPSTPSSATDIATGAPASVTMAFSPRGDLLATASGLAATENYGNPIRLWNTSTGRLVATLTGFDNGVQSIVFTPDGKTLAAGAAGNPGTVKVWDVTTGKLTATLPTGYVIALSPDGKTLATSSEFAADHKASLWDITTGKRIAALAKGRPLGFSGDGQLLALSNDTDQVQVWRVSNRERERVFSGMTTAEFASTGERLALISTTGTGLLVDYASSTSAKTLASYTGTPANIQSIAFAAGGDTLTTASKDGTVQVWMANWPSWVSPSPS